MQRYIQHTVSAVVLSAGVFLAGIQAQAQKVTYSIDPAHSEVDFAIRHMAISTVHGRFGIKEGVIEFDPRDIQNSSVTATIDVASVDTGVAPRDADLKSPRFFDAAKYPTATFKSTRVVRAGDGFDVIGDLTLRGVTKPVTLHMEQPTKEQIGMDKRPHRGFSATTTINRQDFGLNFGGKLASGDAVLGDDVKLTLEVDGAQR